MEEYWTRIENWLADNAPHVNTTLSEGASYSDIEKLEQTIGAKIPTDVADFYRIHNGQNPQAVTGLIQNQILLCTKCMVEQWSIWKKLIDEDDDFADTTSTPDFGIKNDWYNPLWIPLTHDGCGNHFCLDLDPAQGGHYGQIIRVWHDDSTRMFQASSFEKWISCFVADLENGKFEYER